jgi:DNA replication protein DnaC
MTSDIAAQMLEALRGALPYLLAGRMINPIMGILLLPLVIAIMQWIEKSGILRRIWKQDKYSYTVVIESSKDFHTYAVGKGNSYSAICWYLNHIQAQGCVFKLRDGANILYMSDGSSYDCDKYTVHSINGSVEIELIDEHNIGGKSRRYQISHKTRIEQGAEKSEINSLEISCNSEQDIQFLVDKALNLLIKCSLERNMEISKNRQAEYIMDMDRWTPVATGLYKTMQNVHLEDSMRTEIMEDLDAFKQREQFHKQRGIPYKRGYVLYGPPGTGKSSLARAMAHYLRYNMYTFPVGEISTITAYKNLMHTVRSYSVVIFDDVDGLPLEEVQEDGNANGQDVAGKSVKVLDMTLGRIVKRQTDTRKLTLPVLLETLDGYTGLHGCVVVFTTNYPERLDRTLTRSGRIDKHYYIDYPTVGLVRGMMGSYYPELDRAIILPDMRDESQKIDKSTSDIISLAVLPHWDSAEKALHKLHAMVGNA